MQEFKFNKRRKLDRFLASLPEDMIFKSNNEFRIKMPNGYISIGYYYHDYHAFGGGIVILNTALYKNLLTNTEKRSNL